MAMWNISILIISDYKYLQILNYTELLSHIKVREYLLFSNILYSFTRVKPKALCVLGKSPATELYLQFFSSFILRWSHDKSHWP